MASISLNNIANTALKHTGAITMADLTLNMFTRTLAISGYAAVNPWESALSGHAPDEDTDPHNLNDWENYDHSNVRSGVDLEVTVGYQQVRLDWVKASGYNNGLCSQRLHFIDMGTSEDLNDNPFGVGSSNQDAGDGAQDDITGLTANHFYAIGMKASWNDSDEVFTPADGDACNVKAGQTPLIGAGEGLSTGVAVFDDTPSINSITQFPLPANCFSTCSGAACPDFTINITMNGPSTGRLEVSTTSSSGPWGLFDASVGAGASSAFDPDQNPGTTYWYRLRYNDLGSGSPGPWSSVKFLQAQCDLF